MRVNDILTPERTYVDIHGVSKKRLLNQIAQLAHEACPELTEQQIFEALVARERLGSTGVGEGIAIPHCRLSTCHQPVGMLMKLDDPIDFDSADGKPVDLVFVLLVPEDNPDRHLQTLSHLAALFNEEKFRKELRQPTEAEQLYRQAVESEAELQLAS